MQKSILVPVLIAGLGLGTACGKGGAGTAPASDPTPASSAAVVQAIVGGSEDAPLVNQAVLDAKGATVTLDGKAVASSVVQTGVVMVGTTTPGGMPCGDGSVAMRTIQIQSSFVGAIQAIDTEAGTLTVMGQVIQVDAMTRLAQENEDGSHTTLALTDLVAGDFVSVFGRFTAESGFLASRVERAKPGADTTQSGISGKVANLDATARTFTVGTWTVSYATAMVSGALANDAPVQVRGTVAGSTLTASFVNLGRSMGGPGRPAMFRGPVAGLDATAMTFQLLAYTINYAQAKVEGTLADAAMVEVQGALATGSTTLVNATRVVVTLAPGQGGGHGDSDQQVKGAITALDPVAMTLAVGGSTLWADATTVIMAKDATLTFAELKVGDWIAVMANSTKKDAAGNAFATRIEVMPASPKPDPGPEAPAQKLMGPVSAFDATALTLVVNGFTVGVTDATTYNSKGAVIPAATFWSTVAVNVMVEANGTASDTGKTFVATRLTLGAKGGMGGGHNGGQGGGQGGGH